ncbi:uncharacterized protein SCHCODRAFT_01091735 [Schizophyllum commune H4-8]|nr:uncharacterized protein SCHCODRAFT_01091735 [Schizophyllum commune H4-8]KAI5896037.1 hypothetical protein SCHCODRAFT_01091735 [Schizophyllum commune H4-8]
MKADMYNEFAPPVRCAIAQPTPAGTSENFEDDEDDIICLGMSFKIIPGLFQKPDAPRRRIPQAQRPNVGCKDRRTPMNTLTPHRRSIMTLAVNILRDIMERTSTVISGDIALQFFSRITLDNPVLDLYTEYHHRYAVVNGVIALGYLFRPRVSQPSHVEGALHHLSYNQEKDDYVNSIHGVRDVLAFTSSSTGGVCVRVFIVSGCAVDAILSQPHTMQHNIITFRAAYSLYPKTTFVDKISHPVDSLEPNVPAKYAAEGWTCASEVTRARLAHLPRELRAKSRYVGDEHTWTIDFDTTRDRPLDPTLFNSWHLLWWERERGQQVLEPTIERHVYIGPKSWLQNRVLGDVDHIREFTCELGTTQSDIHPHSIEDVLKALIRSGAKHLFHERQPAPAIVRRMDDVEMHPMVVLGIPQLILDSIDDDVPRKTREAEQQD